MVSPLKRLSLALVAAFFLWSTAARAEDDDVAAKPWVVSTELLGFVGGRYGVQVEDALTRRDSLVLYGFVQASQSSGASTFLELDPEYEYQTDTFGFGFDFQYRRWLGSSRAPSGFFVAPGLELQHYVARTTPTCSSGFQDDNPGEPCDAGPARRDSFTYGGVSADIGGQVVVGPGFTMGASLGAHLRGVIGGHLADEGHPWTWDVSNGPGLRPRLRLWVGWAF